MITSKLPKEPEKMGGNTPNHFMPHGNRDKLQLGGPISLSIDFTIR